MSDEITDDEIRSRLKDLDEADVRVTTWEANFIESVLYKFKGRLSDRQRATAATMFEKYGF